VIFGKKAEDKIPQFKATFILVLNKVQQMRKNLEARRAEGKHNAVTENREKYGSR